MRRPPSGSRPRAGPLADLTDGINLYRVVDALRGTRGHAVVGVEDCRSLEVILLPADELRALRLRPVCPAAAT